MKKRFLLEPLDGAAVVLPCDPRTQPREILWYAPRTGVKSRRRNTSSLSATLYVALTHHPLLAAEGAVAEGAWASWVAMNLHPFGKTVCVRAHLIMGERKSKF